MKNITLHSSSILSINAGEHWLGIGAADNSMSLFHRPSNAGTKVSGWQLYRVPQRTAAVVHPLFILVATYYIFLIMQFDNSCEALKLRLNRICDSGEMCCVRSREETDM